MDDGSDQKKVPRTFMGKAYLQELERDLYGLFRNIEVEEIGKDGKPVREKLKAIGPIRLLREARKGEETQVVLRTFHPTENRPLDLVEAS